MARSCPVFCCDVLGREAAFFSKVCPYFVRTPTPAACFGNSSATGLVETTSSFHRLEAPLLPKPEGLSYLQLAGAGHHQGIAPVRAIANVDFRTDRCSHVPLDQEDESKRHAKFSPYRFPERSSMMKVFNGELVGRGKT